jgi:pyruvate kinase
MRILPGKARIVCTLGPASHDVGVLMRMIEVGMDVARLNFSHGSHADHARLIATVRDAASRSGIAVCLMQDLQGPKIRIGELSTPSIDVPSGSTLVITTEPIIGEPGRVSTVFTPLPDEVRQGDTILLDDGKIRLAVNRVEGCNVVCDVLAGGTLSPRKGMNLPGVALTIPAFTPKDLDDLAFGIANDVDYTALSFVRSADDIRALRAAIATLPGGDGYHPIIAKIEKPQALRNIDAIIEEADGIMVARGDLGVEVPPEEVPLYQKSIINRCIKAGKPVIVATQMFESMITNPTPTRAEASDVANAVLDGADAVMLSGETSVGAYPVEAVAMMTRIINNIETHASSTRMGDGSVKDGDHGHQAALGRAACVLAEQIGAAAIVAVTQTGSTARIVARYRPRTPIIAVTTSPATLRRLNLVWGVQEVMAENVHQDSDRTLRAVEARLAEEGILHDGDSYVLIAGQPLFAGGGTNMIKVEKMKVE